MAALVEKLAPANFFAARLATSTEASEISTEASESPTDAPEFSMTRSKFFTRGAALSLKAMAIHSVRPPISTAGLTIQAGRAAKKASAAAKISAVLSILDVAPNFSAYPLEIYADPPESNAARVMKWRIALK